jgi:hypothetical protein
MSMMLRNTGAQCWLLLLLGLVLVWSVPQQQNKATMMMVMANRVSTSNMPAGGVRNTIPDNMDDPIRVCWRNKP